VNSESLKYSIEARLSNHGLRCKWVSRNTPDTDELHEQRQKNDIPNRFNCRASAVITLGARQSANKMLVSHDELAQKNIDVVEIRRGRGTTHIIRDRLLFTDYKSYRNVTRINEYIRKLETIGGTAWTIDLESVTKKISRFVDSDKKIASIGWELSKFVTYTEWR